MDISTNSEFILENYLKPISYPVKFVDALFTIYKQKMFGRQKAPYLLSTEDLMKRSNEKALDLGMGDTCYPNFVPFTMDEFERHLYIYYFNGLNSAIM